MPAFEPFDRDAIAQVHPLEIQFGLETRRRDIFITVKNQQLGIGVGSQNGLNVGNALWVIIFAPGPLPFPVSDRRIIERLVDDN